MILSLGKWVGLFWDYLTGLGANLRILALSMNDDPKLWFCIGIVLVFSIKIIGVDLFVEIYCCRCCCLVYAFCGLGCNFEELSFAVLMYLFFWCCNFLDNIAF